MESLHTITNECDNVIVGTYYHPQTKLREGNVFTPVYDSVHKRGVYPSMQWVGWVYISPWQTDILPLDRHPLKRQLKRAVRILLECILVFNESSITSVTAGLSQR